MGTDSRARASAREKAAEMRAAERRRERRQRILIALGLVVAVVVVIGGLVGVKLASGGKATSTAKPASPASDQIIKDVTSVPTSTFNAVGAGTASNFPSPINPPGPQAAGKPRTLYVGAEYCPYCAAERWALAVALSRFGSFGTLGVTHSSTVDVFPNTATLTFHNASFASDVMAFTAYETATNQVNQAGTGYVPLDTLTAADQQLEAKYNAPPFVPASAQGTIPFIYFDGHYVQSGASYSPQVLAGKTQEQIAASLADPNNAISKAVVGSANVLTAAICTTTQQKPVDVCTSPGVVAGAAKLGTS
ncbi:MAG TPA: DUF929 family protein [Actinomycetes bacterium]|nr:DUF929 family protein [Actinomycetes bacterium]